VSAPAAKFMLGLHRNDEGVVTAVYKMLAEIELEPSEAAEVNRAPVKTPIRLHAVKEKAR
jgi:hypothetical protein